MAERKDLMNIEDLPSNSFKEKEEKKVVKKVKMEAKVKQKKKPLGKRIMSTLCDDDSASVGQYILWDVLIPAFKNTLSDVVTGGIEMLLYGDRGSTDSRTRRKNGRSYISYSGYYEDDDRRRRKERGRRARHEFDDIIFDSRKDAEHVLERMTDLIDDYGEVSVSDFYDMVGMDSTYTDRAWGWYNLRGAVVERGRDGFYIRLPKTKSLDEVPWDK